MPHCKRKSAQAVLLALGMTLAACATQRTRTLSAAEMKEFGLTAIIYDAPICPTQFEHDALRVSGPCEYVTCEAKSGALLCVATKKKP